MSSHPLINQTAEYALRAMSCMALGTDEWVRAEDLALRTSIPRHYVSKILRKLVVARLLEGRKGHHGGFRLARPTAEITLKDVLSAVDALPSSACAFGRPHCNHENPCPLHGSWLELKADYMAWMNRHTLADLEDAQQVCER